MNISEDKVFTDVMQSARDSSNALQAVNQLINRFDKFEVKQEENIGKIEKVVREEVLAVKSSIFQDRDRYFEKKDKPVLEALTNLNTKFDEMNKWKENTDVEIKSAKKWLKGIIITIGSYFGINIKGL